MIDGHSENQRWNIIKRKLEITMIIFLFGYFRASLYGQSRPTSYMPRSPTAIDRVLLNPMSPIQANFIEASTPNEKQRRWRFSSSSTPPPIPPPIERKHRYSFRLSVQELQVTSYLRSFFIKPKRLILIILPITLTIIISVIIIHAQRYIKENIHRSSFSNSTRLFSFCTLYDNNYYMNLVTLPIAIVIILLIVLNQSRLNSCRSDQEKTGRKFSIYTPIPYNPFSKVNRFDTMILCGIVSHEILQIIEEIFLHATDMKSLAIRGPLFDLIRQIGLVIIIGMRYYPIYAVLEMSNANVFYYAFCALYMWIDLVFRVIEQSYCVNIGPLIKTWHRFRQFKNEFTAKYTTNSVLTSTMAMHAEHDDGRNSHGYLRRLREGIPGRRSKLVTTTILPALQVTNFHLNPLSNIPSRRIL